MTYEQPSEDDSPVPDSLSPEQQAWLDAHYTQQHETWLNAEHEALVRELREEWEKIEDYARQQREKVARRHRRWQVVYRGVAALCAVVMVVDVASAFRFPDLAWWFLVAATVMVWSTWRWWRWGTE